MNLENADINADINSENQINYDSYENEKFLIELSYSNDWKQHVDVEKIAQYLSNTLNIIPRNVVNKICLSVLCTTDDEIHNLNKNYRQKDKPTNVLSFQGYDTLDDLEKSSDIEICLGDLVFGYETIVRECEEYEVEFDKYFAKMAIHGLLHLFQFHHDTDEEEIFMNDLTNKILNKYFGCILIKYLD
jgi:probable rRNA maturation factor